MSLTAKAIGLYAKLGNLILTVSKTKLEISNISYSAYTPVDLATTPLTVTASLPNAPTMNTNVSAIGSIGIEFYQQVGTNYYLFNAGNAMKIQDLF